MVQNNIRELQSLITNPLYHQLIADKVSWLHRIGVLRVFVSSPSVIESENISHGGKVQWDKSRLPERKKPLRLFVDVLHFNEVNLLAIFLHECGHVNDKDDLTIKLETQESEISAWQYAIKEFLAARPPKEDIRIFKEVSRKSLLSYDVPIQSIEDLMNL